MTRLDRIGNSLLVLAAVAASQPTSIGKDSRPTPLRRQDPVLSHQPRQAQVAESYGKLPLSFEANRGQASSEVKYQSRGRGYTLALTANAALLMLRGRPASAVRLELVGSSANATVAGADALPGTANYFVGSDSTKWRRNVPTYARVKYSGVYPGVDLVYYGNQGGQLEYDFVVAPGSDPGRIKLRVGAAHASRPTLDTSGNVTLRAGGGVIQLQRPIVYQQDGDRKHQVDARYVLNAGASRLSFAIGSYDRSKPLIIDPVLGYSTFIGGGTDGSNGIAIDGAGHAYLAGDGAVIKLNASGTALLYTTYLDGNVKGIAVDAGGNAYVAGYTFGDDLPVTPGAIQPLRGGRTDGFVVKLDASGSNVLYATYLGGDWYDFAVGIAVDVAGDAYVIATGSAWGYGGTTAWPTTPGAFQETARCCGNHVAVSKLNATGTALIYSTILGGGNNDEIYGIALDGAGHAYVTGYTHSSDFPITAGAYQTVLTAYQNAYVTELSADGSALIYSTFLGGTSGEAGVAITVGRSGNAYVTGYTYSEDFPVTAGALQDVNRGGQDTFVAELNGAGTALIYSTYLGGTSDDVANAIALDGSGNAFVTGYTFSADFPTTTGAFQSVNHAAWTAFVSEIAPSGGALLLSTYLGGTSHEAGTGIAVDASGRVFVTGFTSSADFPITPGAYHASIAGGSDAFVTRFGGGDTQAPTAVCGAADGVWHTTNVSISCTASDAGSGLANAGDAGFSLSTSVSAGAESAGAATNSRTVCDVANNCVTVGPIGGNMIDMRAPSIGIGAPASASYTLNQVVSASFGCSDGGSGVASCVGTVTNGAPLNTSAVGLQGFSVTASDIAGNSAISHVTYSVTYNQCLQFDATKAHPSGSTIPIKLALCDAAGANVSRASVALIATGIYRVSNNAPGSLYDSGNANPDNQFRFADGSYVFNLGLKGFAVGAYALTYMAGSDPTTHLVQFQVK